MSTVPTFRQYFASVSQMNPQQRRFYDAWLEAWHKGEPIDVDGQISYLFCYIYGVLEQSAELVLAELIRVKNAYLHEDKFIGYCDQWISDSFVILGKYRDALESFPKLSPDARSSLPTCHLLSLKYLMGDSISGNDILTLFGPKVSIFGRRHIESVVDYANVVLRAYEHKMAINVLANWVKDSRQFPYSVFRGTYSSSSANIAAYDFSANISVMDFVEQRTREAENTVREEFGLPKVGEGWISETELYYEIKNRFPDFEVKHHARPKWLHNQHLDIYIPLINTAIEYQGAQHDEPIEYFGGQKALKHRRYLDEKKRRCCVRNGVRLVYAHTGYALQDIIQEIEKNTKY